MKQHLSYYMYEASYALMGPARVMNDAFHIYLNSVLNPMSETPVSRTLNAASEMFERATRRYQKPRFGLATTSVNGETATIVEEILWRKPFCNLLHFKRVIDGKAVPASASQPKVLICAPMSGHYATLLRGTVEAFLPAHDVYVTDWVDARDVSLAQGSFDLNDYIDYVIDMVREIGPDVHLMAVCQPAVPVIAAVAYMEANQDPKAPRSMTLMGGPIDTRESPTAVQQAGRGAWHRLVPQELHRHRAFPARRRLPQCLSRFPAALRLHGHEHGPAFDGALGDVPASGEGRRGFG